MLPVKEDTQEDHTVLGASLTKTTAGYLWFDRITRGRADRKHQEQQQIG